MNRKLPLSLLSLALATGACTEAGGFETASSSAALAPVQAPYAQWHERGRLVSYHRVQSLSRWDVRQALFDLPFLDSYASFGLEDFFDFYSRREIDEVTDYGVDVYQVIYETVDPFGVPTTASGAVLAPRQTTRGWRRHEAPALLCLQRGTVFYDADVPSTGQMEDWGIWRGLLPASHGYLTAMPDLLGFGAAKHMAHSYLVSDVTATASVDLMRATRHLAAEQGWELRDEVFLAGLSQGGHGTLSTQRLIEAEHAAEFHLAGSAPAATPSFVSAIASAFYRSDVLIAPQVSTLILLVFDEYYGINRGPSYYFRPPYDEVVPLLHDKAHNNAEVIAGLPTGASDQLFTETFLQSFRGNGEQALKAALQANDQHTGWTPVTPTRLVHGTEDSVIPLIQSQAAAANLGAQVQVVPIAGADHLQTIVPGTLYTLAWFDQILGR